VIAGIHRRIWRSPQPITPSSRLRLLPFRAESLGIENRNYLVDSVIKPGMECPRPSRCRSGLRTFSGRATCGLCPASPRTANLESSLAPPPTWHGQVGVNFAATHLKRVARHLPARIDAQYVYQKQGGVRRNERINIRHDSVLPKERTAVSTHVARRPTHFAVALIASLALEKSPVSVPRSVITPSRQRKA
jgi:hypothetical protein